MPDRTRQPAMVPGVALRNRPRRELGADYNPDSLLPPLLERVRRIGHTVFTRGSYNLNLIGIRRNVHADGYFTDWLTAHYRDSDGEWTSHWWTGTTDPGLYWLRKPMNVNGTAIVVPGQYPGLWKVGTHKGYKAFQQVGEVAVYRDNDRDADLDMDPATIERGHFGINGHASDGDPWDKYDRERTGDLVGQWSAGCQVWASSAAFRHAIRLAEQSAAAGFGSTLTYTLVTDDELNAVELP